MAGTLTISTLSDGTNSTSSTNCIQGSAKAWVNFSSASGTSCVIASSYNVSSVTYNAAGNYQINFTNAFADTNYSVVGSVSQVAAGGSAMGVFGKRYDTPVQTTTAFGCYTLASSTAVTTNYPFISVTAFR